MLKERLQLLISAEQRKRLEDEARRTGRSVGALVREAIDARFGAVTREDRLQAVEEIRSMESGHFLPPDELGRLSDCRRGLLAHLGAAGRPTATAKQHDAICPNLRRVSLVAVFVIPLARLQAAFHVNLPAFNQILGQ